MAIVGFNFTRIIAERKSQINGKININNNVVISSVEDANVPFSQERKGIKVRFVFESVYQPNVAVIHFEGEVLLLEPAKVAQEVLERWAKEKALPQGLIGTVLNAVLDRSNVEAILLSRDLGLPAPVPLPKANLSQGAGKAPKAEEMPVTEDKKVEQKPTKAKKK